MRSRHWKIVIFVLTLGSVLLYAEKKEFWTTKPYADWTEKEVDKLLKDSPWAKTIPLSTGPEAMASSRGRGEGEADMPAGGEFKARPMLFIRWHSRVVREAGARRMMLINPQIPKDQLDQLVNRPESAFYSLSIEGWNPGRNKEANQKLREETYLQTKQNKERIPLKNVIMPQKRGDPLVLHFAREAGGQQVITLEDKEILLVLKMGDNTIRASFKLADMVVNGKLEL